MNTNYAWESAMGEENNRSSEAAKEREQENSTPSSEEREGVIDGKVEEDDEHRRLSIDSNSDCAVGNSSRGDSRASENETEVPVECSPQPPQLNEELKSEANAVKHGNNICLTEQHNRNSAKQKPLSTVSMLKTPSDGYNWRKYGEKQVKNPKGSRSYYKCTFYNCFAKKIKCCDRSNRFVETIYVSPHNHDPPRKVNCSSENKPSSPVVPVNTSIGSKHPVRCVNDPVPFSHSKEPLREPDAIHVELKSEANAVQQGNNICLTEQDKRNSVKQKPFSTVHMLKTPDDGYNWRKYGEKQVKNPEGSRSYYRCTFYNCFAKKIKCCDHSNRFVKTIYASPHNHDPPRKVNCSRENKPSSPVVPVNTSIGSKHPVRCDNDPVPSSPSKEPLRVPDAIHEELKSEANEVQHGNNICLTEQDKQNSAKQKPLSTVPMLKTPSDGYNWRKYGEKQVKNPEGSRSYYRCTFYNCFAKKIKCCDRSNLFVKTIYASPHNHDPPRKVNCSRENRPSSPVVRVNTSIGSKHPVRCDNDPVPSSPSKEPLREPDAIYEELKSEANKVQHGNNICLTEQDKRNYAKQKPLSTVPMLKTPSDGYNWRNYGEKQVKNPEGSRSYYRCTFYNCFAKKIKCCDRSNRLVETRYGSPHNHDPPQRVNSSGENKPCSPVVPVNTSIGTKHSVRCVNDPLPPTPSKESLPEPDAIHERKQQESSGSDETTEINMEEHVDGPEFKRSHKSTHLHADCVWESAMGEEDKEGTSFLASKRLRTRGQFKEQLSRPFAIPEPIATIFEGEASYEGPMGSEAVPKPSSAPTLFAVNDDDELLDQGALIVSEEDDEEDPAVVRLVCSKMVTDDRDDDNDVPISADLASLEGKKLLSDDAPPVSGPKSVSEGPKLMQSAIAAAPSVRPVLAADALTAPPTSGTPATAQLYQAVPEMLGESWAFLTQRSHFKPPPSIFSQVRLKEIHEQFAAIRRESIGTTYHQRKNFLLGLAQDLGTMKLSPPLAMELAQWPIEVEALLESCGMDLAVMEMPYRSQEEVINSELDKMYLLVSELRSHTPSCDKRKVRLNEEVKDAESKVKHLQDELVTAQAELEQARINFEEHAGGEAECAERGRMLCAEVSRLREALEQSRVDDEVRAIDLDHAKNRLDLASEQLQLLVSQFQNAFLGVTPAGSANVTPSSMAHTNFPSDSGRF